MSELHNGAKLDNQVCFPLYAASREIIKLYKPYLDQISLTYTQYLAMLVLWEQGSVNVKELGSKLYLDSGTLSSVLKKLEEKGYVTRARSKADERNLIIQITPEGNALQPYAAQIPEQVAQEVTLKTEESEVLYHLLYKLLGQ